MQAMVIRRFGGPEVFELAELNKPAVKPGYVLVKVSASSVNPIELKIRSGLVPAIAHEFPAVLNSDFSGQIVAVGDDTAPWKIGDKVFGFAGGAGTLQGALAEYMLVDAKLIAKKPNNIDDAQAALFPVVSITAWEALVEKASVKIGDKVLIHGAAGGVGQIALQIAKAQGAIVYGTVRREEQTVVAKAFGADYIINTANESVEEYTAKYTDNKGFDIVMDPVGGDNLANSFKAVKMKGAVCTTNARVTVDIGLMHSKAISLHAVFIMMSLLYNRDREKHGQILQRVAALIEANKLRIHVDKQQFRFDEIAKAHEYVESRKALGKVSLISSFI
ncbi:2-haloacrylate reductase [bioreactor metagenome]|uniref:2-haloacrylate reductase n=1 Tax=bioreactor metagenome TaxID=1076179 RepID=A0A644TQQ1_9ZZZZ|nr:zinc-dependent alcohol dehydrogenase family protein [Negativicutes bacterium]